MPLPDSGEDHPLASPGSWSLTSPAIFLLFFLCLVAAATSRAFADEGCYVLANGTSSNITVNFTYTVAPGVQLGDRVTSITLQPSGKYTTCFGRGVGAKAEIASGVDQWYWRNFPPFGPLLMGDETGAEPACFAPPCSEAYTIKGPPAQPVASSSKVIDGLYVITSEQCCHMINAVTTFLDLFGDKCTVCGVYKVMNVSIKCQPTAPAANFKWNLVCKVDGSICNTNDHQLAYGMSTWNIAEHCRHPDAHPNG